MFGLYTTPPWPQTIPQCPDWCFSSYLGFQRLSTGRATVCGTLFCVFRRNHLVWSIVTVYYYLNLYSDAKHTCTSFLIKILSKYLQIKILRLFKYPVFPLAVVHMCIIIVGWCIDARYGQNSALFLSTSEYDFGLSYPT
jgi:hypothetical protein